MDYTNGYGYEDNYLNDDDDGLMCCTKDYCSDSDDEIKKGDSFSSVFANRLPKKSGQQSDEDEFEKQMSAELSNTMEKLISPLIGGEISTSKKLKSKETPKEFYDNIYFDTDESDEEEGDSSVGKRKKKKLVQTNDDLLYDPNMDEDDQKWIDQKRRSYQMRKSFKGNGMKPLPQSDAVLNCPACFTTLCLDCQRHDIYKEQYRAMFVFNCVVDDQEILHFTKKENKKKFKKERKAVKFSEESFSMTSSIVIDEKDSKDHEKNLKTSETSINSEISSDANNLPACNSSTSSNSTTSNVIMESEASVNLPIKKKFLLTEDDFHPVKCSVCNTKVAVQDQDEIYHFFNIITSY